MNITNWSIKHPTTVFVLMGVIAVMGLVAYKGLPREAAPDITIPYVLISTPYIGVSPADIETLITDPIEEELEQLKDVREIRSTSADGASIIWIEFEPTVDIDNALQLVRERVDIAKVDLPAEAEEPIVTEISFSEWPIMVINVSGDVGLVQLKKVAEDLQDRIESIPGILQANLVGGLEREVIVEADPRRLEFYRVSLGELAASLDRGNINMPGGSVELGDLAYSVRVPGEYERVSEIERLVIREEAGEPIRVEHVAEVIDGFEERSTYSRLNGVESVSLSVTRRAGENIPRIAGEIREILASFEESYADQVSFAILADVSGEISDRVNELENNIITGLLLVAAVLFFFMGGLRNALFVAIAIPLSMLISFGVLAVAKITLNIVVLFSLVLALGMLVDNAIVIVENIYRHATMGKDNVTAARDGVAEVAWPVIASTATTVTVFIPLLFWPGIVGEFMSYLPLTVIIVLCSSLFVALVINPVICSVLLRTKRGGVAAAEAPRDKVEGLPSNFVYGAYRAVLLYSVRHRWVVAVLTIGAFVGTFVVYGRNNGGVEFFPETTPERFFISVTLPDGSNLDSSDRVVRAVERVLEDEANIANWVAEVGAGGNDLMSGGGGAAHQSRITVELLPVDERIESPYDTIARIREETAGIVGAEIEILKEDSGPPSGPPINIEVVGDELTELGAAAQELRELIRGVEGVVNLTDDLSDGRPEISVIVDRDTASTVGADLREIANTVRMAVAGMDATVYREATEEHDVVVRLPERYRDSVEDIARLRIRTVAGVYVPLSEVADIDVRPGFGSIRHLEGDRVVTVSAEVAEGYNADALLAGIQAQIGADVVLSPGYEVRYTGQNQDQKEAEAFLSKAFLGALFLMALILVTQFNSLTQPMIILASVLLSLLGVLWVLVLRQLPFNIIMTGVGIISLAGVVVNNAIVLIDYTNQLKARGMSSKEAVVAAGMVRLRPVMLTAITTILSLMPIVLGFSIDVANTRIVFGGTSVEMWGPMANAVVAGLAVATLFTLVVVPVMYSGIDSGKDLLGRIIAAIRRRGAVMGAEVAVLAAPLEATTAQIGAGKPSPPSAPEPAPTAAPEPEPDVQNADAPSVAQREAA